MKKYFPTAFFFVLFAYLVLAISSAFTLLPNVDEAWFTNPGYNLATHGFFGTTVLDETATFRQVSLDGIGQHTYWIMPAYPLLQAGVGKAVGFGLIQTRGVSIFFGVVALFAWTFLIRKLSGSAFLSVFAVALMAVDMHFIYAASEGRMDMIAAALGINALAVFVWLREKNLSRAVLFSSVLTAFSFFTHPLGSIWIVSLAVLIVMLDLKRIRFKHFPLAAAPFVIMGALWLVYIVQEPEIFARQFGGNASDRWGFFAAPLTALWNEISLRYVYNFGIGEGIGGAGQIKIVVLICFTAAVIGLLSSRSLRKERLPRFLLFLAALQFLMLLLFDGMHQHYYLVHITPSLAVILAVWVNWLWSQKSIFRWASPVVLLIVVVIAAGVNLQRIARNQYRAHYLAAVDFVNRSTENSDMVMGSAEIWFAMDRRENLLDDYRLGYRSGKRGDLIVIDKPRYQDWIGNLQRVEPETHRYIEGLLQNEYELTYEDGIYRIYERKR